MRCAAAPTSLEAELCEGREKGEPETLRPAQKQEKPSTGVGERAGMATAAVGVSNACEARPPAPPRDAAFAYFARLLHNGPVTQRRERSGTVEATRATGRSPDGP
ncbi:hypothetical protein AAFF_G00128160 [Aldrovandia affinis]|uniref:Uncharacterized protein n=1 Tax=Aldrovandia affinis TaxID=143900 RepID=A0AAD7T1H3_9TELE|nr:hypothetical protein AAFF_G00128160 [Aldrovandia affinis]